MLYIFVQYIIAQKFLNLLGETNGKMSNSLPGTFFSYFVLGGIRIASNSNRTKEVGESVQKGGGEKTKEEVSEEVAGVVGVRGARKCECVCACVRARVPHAKGKRTTERPVSGMAARNGERRGALDKKSHHGIHCTSRTMPSFIDCIVRRCIVRSAPLMFTG